MEAALVLPLVILLIFAVFEYGWLFLKFQNISNAARQGARVAAVYSTTGATSGTSAAGTAAANVVLSAAGILGHSTVSITPGGMAAQGAEVKAVVTLDFSSVAILHFLPVPSTLTSATTMLKEGPIPPSGP